MLPTIALLIENRAIDNMNDVPPKVGSSADLAFEREKWLKECEFREKELALQDREVSVREHELVIKKNESKRWFLANPLILAVVAASVAAFANVYVAFRNASAQRVLERSQAESARIVTAISGNTDAASDKLRFLLDTKLITDPEKRKSILEYIDTKVVTTPATPPPPPPPAASTVKRVTVSSGFMGGCNNRASVCGSLAAAAKAQVPGSTEAILVGSSEQNRKDFLGHVTYKYTCDFDVKS